MADDSVVITLSGEAGALIASLQQASDRFDMLRATLNATSDAAKVFGDTFAQQAAAWLDASDSVQLYQAKLDYLNSQSSLTRDQQDLATQSIRDYTAQLSLARDAMNVLNDAQKVMGDGFAMQANQWLQAATSADDYAARLAYVREQIAMTQDQMAMMNSASESSGLAGLLGNLGGGGGFFGGLVGMFDDAGLLGDMAGPFGILAGGIDSATNAIGGFVEQSASFLTTLAAWSVIQDVISWVQQLSDELFNLQVNTQRLSTGWQYLFGGPDNGGKAASQSMMQWTSQFSLGIPFTRQDLLTGVSTLASIGMTPQQIQQFMPYLSDIAATYGSSANQGMGTNITQATNAIRMATYGRSLDLKTQLNISPQELEQYGLQATGSGYAVHITDMNSLYTALENFAKAKHLAGASQGIVGSTWWGGWSSLVDNFQNLLLSLGGTNLKTGELNPGQFFAELQQDLDNLLQWFSTHQEQLQKFSDIASHLLGDVVNTGGGLLAQLAQWFEKLGGVGAIESSITNIDDTVRQWFGLDKPGTLPTDKKHPMGGRQKYADEINAESGLPQWMQQLAQYAQAVASISWDAIMAFLKTAAQDGPAIAQQFANIAHDFSVMGTSMTPDEAKVLDDLAKVLGTAAGGAAVAALWGVDQAIKGIQRDAAFLLPSFQTLHYWIDQSQQAAHLLALGFKDVVNALKNLPSVLPSWMTHVLQGGGLGSLIGSTSGGGQGQATRTPGLGSRSFGVIGA